MGSLIKHSYSYTWSSSAFERPVNNNNNINTDVGRRFGKRFCFFHFCTVRGIETHFTRNVLLATRRRERCRLAEWRRPKKKMFLPPKNLKCPTWKIFWNDRRPQSPTSGSRTGPCRGCGLRPVRRWTGRCPPRLTVAEWINLKIKKKQIFNWIITFSPKDLEIIQ